MAANVPALPGLSGTSSIPSGASRHRLGMCQPFELKNEIASICV